MTSSRDNLYELKSSLEKILKALIIKLENGDELTVVSELIWFDDLLARILNLIKQDHNKFKSLIDPSDKFKYVEPIDIATINWKDVKIIERTSQGWFEQEDHRTYRLTILESQYDLLDTFLFFAIKIWEASIAKENYELEKRALYIIGNLYSQISLGADPTR